MATYNFPTLDPDTRSLRSLLRDDKTARPYADPYLTGVVLGLVLLAAFVLVGRGLGATGAFASVAATALRAVSPGAAQGNAYFAERLPSNGLWSEWLVVEIA